MKKAYSLTMIPLWKRLLSDVQVVSGLLVLAFLLLGLTSLNAQTYYPDLVSPSQAETMLSNEIPLLENALGNYTPGTSSYTLAERKLNMYMHTWEEIVSGRDVEAALTASYGEFAIDASGNGMSEDELPEVSKNGLDYGDSVFDELVGFLQI